MKRWFIATILLVTVASVHAASMFVEVTPGQVDVHGLKFDIKSEKLPDGAVKFRVVVSTNRGEFSSDTSTGLAIVKVMSQADWAELARAGDLQKDGKQPAAGFRKGFTESVESVREVVSEIKDRSITCVFSVDKTALENPDFCFVLTLYAHAVVGGKLVPMPSADFLYARLKNFAVGGKP